VLELTDIWITTTAVRSQQLL